MFVLKKRKYNILDLLLIPIQCAPFSAIAETVRKIIVSFVPALQVVVTAKFIDTSIQVVNNHGSVSDVIPWILAVAGALAYSWLNYSLGALLRPKTQLGLRKNFRTAIIYKLAKLDYYHIENIKSQDLISRVAAESDKRFERASWFFLTFINIFLKLVGLVGILVMNVWWVAVLLFVLSAPLFVISLKGGKATYQAEKEATKAKRTYGYYSEILTGREAVDERTLFGFGGKISQKWMEQYEIVRKILFKINAKWVIRKQSGGTITSIISMLVMIALVFSTVRGEITIGLFIAISTAISGIVESMTHGMPNCVFQISYGAEFMRDLTELAALSETEGVLDLPSEAVKFESLEFKNVTFKYPNTEKYVLKNCSFIIHSGRHYAFVGENGAGKTTITKLATCLYHEYDGEILINGRNIKEYTYSEIKSFYALVFQDFARYYITLKDNIAIGNTRDMRNTDIFGAVDMLGLTEAVSNLPDKENSYLGKIKNGGTDLSGGQWQRIAMARAFVSQAPLQILDEPTAALDPVSESKIYQEFECLSQNKTTIFISHRLGSTKLADEIFVLSNGAVVESGTHDRLMSLDGIYAQMYSSQRSWYE